MLLQDRLPFFIDAEIDSEQRGPVCIKTPRIEQDIFQMILVDVGLGKRGINEIIRSPVFPFEEELGSKLRIRLKMQDFCLIQMQGIYIFGKFSPVIIPKYQFPDSVSTCMKFFIQSVFYLLEI